MRLHIELCDTIAQLVERRTTLTGNPYKGELLHQSSDKPESGEIVRHLVTSAADGGTNVSRGATFDEFSKKFVLVVMLP